MATKSVIVFFDWQNVYMRAREAFYDPKNDPPPKGQANPVDLAHVLCADHARRHPEESFDLTQIRIYRGRPTQQADTKGYSAFQRQAAAWGQNRKIIPRFADLHYPSDWGEPGCAAPREKGIDVALAVDLVTQAIDSSYDVAIVMSADYDLVPAIDYVVRRRHTRASGPLVEVAAWRNDAPGRKPLRIRLPNQPLHCIWLDHEAFWGVEDTTDYSTPAARRRPGPPVPGSWLRR